MDLTLESAFSTGGLVGHLSYILLVLSMVSRSMPVLRVTVILSALAAIAFDWVWLRNPVGVFWESLLVLVNVVQLFLLWNADRGARFSAEEERFVQERLRLRSRGAARRLLDAGEWVALPVGEELTVEGRRPEAMWFISEGEVEIRREGTRIGLCGPGSFVGELAILEEDGVASATAVVSRAGRAWRLPYAALDRLEAKQPAGYGALQGAIARDMRRKIIGPGASAAPV